MRPLTPNGNQPNAAALLGQPDFQEEPSCNQPRRGGLLAGIVSETGQIERLMATTGLSVGLLYDTGHCVFSGGDPEALLRRHVKRVVHDVLVA